MALPILINDEPRSPAYPGREGLCRLLEPTAVAGMPEKTGRGLSNRSSRSGFTLVEVLIVVTILAILSATVLPTFVSSTDDARDATLQFNLQAVRHQLHLFRAEHKGDCPGYAGIPAMVHLIAFSDAEGAVSMSNSASFPYGPYLSYRAVANPFNSGIVWKSSSDPPAETPDESMTSAGGIVGWFYDKDSGRISANAEGATSDGIPRVQL